jgi:hypothetical protein
MDDTRPDKLVNIHGLAAELQLPRYWLSDKADAGQIPVLKIGSRRRLFSTAAVRAALLQMAAAGRDIGELPPRE